MDQYFGEPFSVYEEPSNEAGLIQRGSVADSSRSFALGPPSPFFDITPQMKSLSLEGSISTFNTTDFSAFSSLTTFVPDSPIWWEPNSHWISQDNNILWRCAVATTKCSTTKADFVLKKEEHCLKGICYGTGQSSATFSVRVFQAPKNQSGFLVEVSRRSGDSFTYRNFYEELKQLVDADLGVEQSTSQFDYSDNAWLQEEEPLDSDSIASIMMLASSKMADQAREGMALLASCCQESCNHKEIMASEFFETVLLSGLKSPDTQISRSAASLLLFIVKGGNVTKLPADILQALVDILAKPEELESLQRNRFVKELLEQLSPSDPSISKMLRAHPPLHLTDDEVAQWISCTIRS